MSFVCWRCRKNAGCLGNERKRDIMRAVQAMERGLRSPGGFSSGHWHDLISSVRGSPWLLCREGIATGQKMEAYCSNLSKSSRGLSTVEAMEMI